MKPATSMAIGSLGTVALIGVGVGGYLLGRASPPLASVPPEQRRLTVTAPTTLKPTPTPTSAPSPTSKRVDCYGTWIYLPLPGSARVSFGLEVNAKRASMQFADYSPGSSGTPKFGSDGSVRMATEEGMLALIDCDPGAGTATVLWDLASYRMKRISGTFQAFALKNGLMGD